MFISTRWVRGFVFGAALVLGGTFEAAAQGGGAPMTPLAYRQGIMQQFQANLGALTAVRTGQTGAPGHAFNRATILQQLALMLSEAFPEGSATEGSRALPVIWTTPTEFSQRVQAVQAATGALVEAARGGDMAQIAAAQTAVQGACGGCHMQFRGPAPAR